MKWKVFVCLRGGSIHGENYTKHIGYEKDTVVNGTIKNFCTNHEVKGMR